MSDEDRRKWEERYAAKEGPPGEPETWLLAVADLLPRTGRALDVAGGTGRHALWLAERGLEATLVDISPTALRLAAAAARERGLPLALCERDLEVDPLPAGPWDVIVDAFYLRSPLYAALREELAVGGLLIVIQPTLVNLERHEKPPAPFLLEPGELPRLVEGLEIVRYEEGWNETGRHDARLVARRRGK